MAVELVSSVERSPGRVVLSIGGDLDIASAQAFRDASLDALGIEPVTMVLDLSEVPFIDSSGITVLVLLRRKARSRRSDLRVVTNRRIDGVLAIAGLTQAFSLHDSVEAALRGPSIP